VAITSRQLDVAKRTLAATGRKYGVALGGGNALNIHEQLIHDATGIARETQDLDFFVSRPRNVRRAVDAVVAVLANAGYAVDRDGGGEVRDITWLRRMLADWPREPLRTD
jgi:hypothetical protein